MAGFQVAPFKARAAALFEPESGYNLTRIQGSDSYKLDDILANESDSERTRLFRQVRFGGHGNGHGRT